MVEGKGLPAMPADLTPHAKKFWREFVPALQRMGVLDKVDRHALRLMATQYGRAMEAAELIKTEGLVAVGSQGQTVVHPAVKIEQAAAALVFRMMEHYCGTPVARARQGLAMLEAASLAKELDAAFTATGGDE